MLIYRLFWRIIQSIVIRCENQCLCSILWIIFRMHKTMKKTSGPKLIFKNMINDVLKTEPKQL